MKISAVLFLGLIAFVAAQYEENNYPQAYRPRQAPKEEQHLDYHDEPNYKYEYKVDDYKTGDFKGQAETREGDTVKGFYMLREADGTIREVHYTADNHNGFNAVVKKTGTPTPAPEQEEQPKHQPIKKIYHPKILNQIFREALNQESEYGENNKYVEEMPQRRHYGQQ